MPERSPDRPPTAPRADATRDIRLPPLPDRPAPAVPQEWSSYVPAAPALSDPPAGATAVRPSTAEAPTAEAPTAEAPTAEGPTAEAPPAPVAAPPRSVDEPTDRHPADHPLRQSTRAFTPPPSVQLLKVSVTPRRRITTKVLWTLIILTLAVIIACGVYLVVLVNHR
jgi:hypothetical protein